MHSRALVPVALVGTLLGGCADSTPVGLPAARLLGDAAAVASAAPGLTALTWNVYVGAEIERVVQAGSPEEAIQIATEQWANVQATNFPRARREVRGLHVRPLLGRDLDRLLGRARLDDALDLRADIDVPRERREARSGGRHGRRVAQQASSGEADRSGVGAPTQQGADECDGDESAGMHVTLLGGRATRSP